MANTARREITGTPEEGHKGWRVMWLTGAGYFSTPRTSPPLGSWSFFGDGEVTPVTLEVLRRAEPDPGGGHACASARACQSEFSHARNPGPSGVTTGTHASSASVSRDSSRVSAAGQVSSRLAQP